MLAINFTFQDFGTICRTCLQSKSPLTPLLESDAGHMLNYCQFCNETQDKSFPDKICEECMNVLVLCYKFKQQCETARYTLEKVLCEDKINTEHLLNEINTDSLYEKKSEKLDSRLLQLNCYNLNSVGDNRRQDEDTKIHIIELKQFTSSIEQELNDHTNTSFAENSNDAQCVDAKDKSEIDDNFTSFLEEPLQKPISNYACPHCVESFKEKEDLKIHQSVHNANELICIECSKSFKTRKMLKRHVKTHLKQKSHVCNLCGKGFSESYALTKHLRKHSGIPREKKHICEHCGQGFSEPYYLHLHLRKHTGDRPLVCSECKKSFSDPRSFKSHQMTHTGEKPYSCTYCNKRFSQRANLTRHVRIHTGDKPYLCKECGKRFTQSSSLDKHLRIHSGEKPYACDICDKRFTEKTNLRNHLKVHNVGKAKTFNCDNCLQTFKDEVELHKHKEQHTLSMKAFQCSICFKEFTFKNSLKKHLKLH